MLILHCNADVSVRALCNADLSVRTLCNSDILFRTLCNADVHVRTLCNADVPVRTLCNADVPVRTLLIIGLEGCSPLLPRKRNHCPIGFSGAEGPAPSKGRIRTSQAAHGFLLPPTGEDARFTL